EPVAGGAAGNPALRGDDRAPGAAPSREVRRTPDRAPVDKGAPDVGAGLADAEAVTPACDGRTEADEPPCLAARYLLDVHTEAQPREGGEPGLQPLARIYRPGVDAADADPRRRA